MTRAELSTESIAQCPYHPGKDLFEQMGFLGSLEGPCRTGRFRADFAL